MSVCSVVAAMDPSSWVEQQLVLTMVARGSFGHKSGHRVEITKCKGVYKATGDGHYTVLSSVLFVQSIYLLTYSMVQIPS